MDNLLNLSRGPWRVSTQRRGRAIEAADGTTVGAAHIGPGLDEGRWASNANVLAAAWSFYRAAKLRAKYESETDTYAVRPAYEAWQAMEAQAMAIAEGRPLPVTRDAEAR